MRTINLIVIHCSATREDRPFSMQELEAAHRLRGMDGIGYHFYILRNGDIKSTRPIERIGAHAHGYNTHSIGICYEGGLDSNHKPSDTRTLPQKASLVALLRELKQMFPNVLVVGHHDLNPMKECPCFNAVTEYRGL